MEHPAARVRATPRGALLAPSLLCLASLAAASVLTFRAEAAGPVAAVFPPWWDAARSVVAAGSAGPTIRPGGIPFVVVVAAADEESRAVLRRAGAWLLLDPRAALGCVRA